MITVVGIAASLVVITTDISEQPVAPSDITESPAGEVEEDCFQNSCVITYQTAFFDRYNPITALDMLRNLPGFQIDNGDGSRGFGGSAGNVLINGERVAAKSETASDVLARTSVSAVERIDLIRGQTGGLDLRGQSIVANVILKQDVGGSAAWLVRSTVNLPSPGVFPFGRFSYSDKIGGLSYTVGGEAERTQFRAEGLEQLLDGDGFLRERRNEVFEKKGFRGEASLNAQLDVGRTAIRLNTSLGYSEDEGGEVSERIPTDVRPTRFVLQGDADEELSIEIGGDIERPFGDAIVAKLIGLYRSEEETDGGSRSAGATIDEAALRTVIRSETLDTESILRIELDYSGITGHIIEISAEGAVNRLDSVFSLLADDGMGLVSQNVPGAVTQVRETRGDFSISDSWSLGPVGFDSVVAAETSSIEQTGGFEAARSFFFMKPSLTATYAPNQATQFRMRALREIGQLNFSDFVSSTDLGDEELELGNPDLAPETVWTIDASLERRFGDIGVVTVTAFYDWISDVEDILPIGDGLEVPGNIGAGVRRGFRAEGSAPLDAFGLVGGRLDFSGEYQFSEVMDPVTGEMRRLSDERGWEAAVEFRQDLPAQQWAWGWDVNFYDERLFFGLDERNVRRNTPDFNAFVETTRLAGMRIRLNMENLLNEGFDRDRTVFDGVRGVAPVRFRELRERNSGREIVLSLSGNF